jgi:hypothetical protein
VTSEPRDARERELRAKNLRTGLILAAIALAFFLGFLIRRTL